MDEEQRDYPAYIPDDWAEARARDYHYGAASASQQPQAPYVQDPDAWQSWADSHTADAAAFTAMQVFVQQLSVVGRRPIDHAPPGCPTVMRDELVLLRLFAAAQDRDPARFAAHFRWLAASPPDPTAQRAATFVAAALIAHGQRLSSPDAVEPAPERSTVKPRAPIHNALRVASRPWAQDAPSRDRDIALNE